MRRLQIVAGIAFVGAWIVGLLLATDGPKPSASASDIATYYDNHEAKSMVATFLIDGVAGLAIVAIAYCLWRYFADQEGWLRQLVLWAGIGAGLASIAQMIVGETMAYRAAHGTSAGDVKTLFKVLNNGDTVKIALLAIMIAAASWLALQSGAFARWLAIAGLIFAPLLAMSGFAFPLNSDALYGSLAATLLGLLIWVIAETVSVVRRTSVPSPRPAMS